MSVIIGICGKNFCTFISDSRTTKLDPKTGTWVTKSDNVHKVIRLNDKVIYGAAGIFHGDNFFKPLDCYPNRSIITIRMAVKATEDYISNTLIKSHHGVPMVYLIGGKNNKGNFEMYRIEYVPESNTMSKRKCFFEVGIEGTGIALIAPAELSNEGIELLETQVNEVIHCAKTHNDAIKIITDILNEVAKLCPSINNKFNIDTIC